MHHLPSFPNYTHLIFEEYFTSPPSFPSTLIDLKFLAPSTVDVTLPESLLSLSIKFKEANQWFETFLKTLPSSLTFLSLQSLANFSQKYQISILPPKLTNLQINSPSITLDFSNPLPSSLKTLYTHNWPQSAVTFPPSLSTLILGSNYNSPLDYLPTSLKYLELGTQFDQPINNLPHSLTRLKLGFYFNQPINSLPDSLSHLHIKSTFFNQPLECLPSSLISLIIESKTFNHNLDKLPNSIIHLELHLQLSAESNNNKIEFLNPVNIKEYDYYRFDSPTSCFSHPIQNLPISLQTFIYYSFIDNPLPPLPSTITTLIVGNDYNQPLSKLPPSLHTLILGPKFDQLLPYLPFTLTNLALRNRDYALPLLLPPFISCLKIGTSMWIPAESQYDYFQLERHGKKWSIILENSSCEVSFQN